MTITLALLIVYSALIVAIGLWIGRRVRTTAAFFVAGRSLPGWLLGATLLAANIGAGSTVGAAGLGYRDGLSAWWWVGSAGIGSFLLAWWIGPRLWRIASREEQQTLGDFLEWRYGALVRASTSAILWLVTLTILAGQLIALSEVLNAVAGVPRVVGCTLGALVMVAYFTAGGLVSSAWVNLVQLIVLLAGFALAMPFALAAAGGLGATLSQTPHEGYLAFWQGGGSGWHHAWYLVPSFIVSPGLVQKVYGAKDERAVRSGTAVNALVLLVFAAVPVLLGMAARVIHPDLPRHEAALPVLLVEDVPAAIGGLGLAALFSAEVSTADAILFMLATSLSRDLYRRFLRPAATDREVLRVARTAAVSGGVLGAVLALTIPTVIDALRVFYMVLSVTLFAPVVLGLFVPRAGSTAAVASIAVGLIVLFVGNAVPAAWWLFGLPPPAAGLVASSVAFLAGSLTAGPADRAAAIGPTK